MKTTTAAGLALCGAMLFLPVVANAAGQRRHHHRAHHSMHHGHHCLFHEMMGHGHMHQHRRSSMRNSAIRTKRKARAVHQH